MTMKTFQLYILILSCFLIHDSFGQMLPHWQWAKGDGGTGKNDANGIYTDPDGNSFLFGFFEANSVTFDNITLTNPVIPSRQTFIVKYDSSGNVLWASHPRSSSGSSYAIGASTDGHGNLYIAGGFGDTMIFDTDTLIGHSGSNAYIAKYDAQHGNEIWSRSAIGFGAGDNQVNSITSAPSGWTYVTGQFSNDSIRLGSFTLRNTHLNHSGPRLNIFIAKYDASGNVAWARSAGGSVSDWAYSISSDTYGNIYIGGTTHSPSINFDGTIISSNGADTSMFIARYNASGDFIWAKLIAGNAGISGICSDNLGYVYAAGAFESPTLSFPNHAISNGGTKNIFIAQYDTSGNVLWAKSDGGSGSTTLANIATDYRGSLYVSGIYNSNILTLADTQLTASGSNGDIFIGKYDTAGRGLWAMSAGGSGFDVAWVGADTSSGVYIGGTSSSSSLSLGSIVLNNSPQLDAFAAKLGYGNVTGIFSPTADMDIQCYPNPSNGSLYITNTRSGDTIMISDLLGQNLLKQEISNRESPISLEGFKGLVLWHIIRDGQLIAGSKIILE